jgi:hypothetical protein
MIRVAPTPEPAEFDENCRRRGWAWLDEHAEVERRPRDYWSKFEPELRAAFGGRCAYCAMRVMKAQVDHFIPVAELRRRGQLPLAYEWSNFRYGEGILNQRKHDALIFDPFDVEDDWFEMHLPSLQLTLTDRVPEVHRELLDSTLDRLGLVSSEVVVRYRHEWFRMYRESKLSLEGLLEVAPLIGRAVQRDLDAGRSWLHGDGV